MAFPVDLIDKVKDYFPTGSRVICNPPILNTDEDWVALVRDGEALRGIKKYLIADEWEQCGRDYEIGPFNNKNNNRFVSFRKGEVNLIITDSAVTYDRYKVATRIATRLNLFNKEDRVALFQIIRDHDFTVTHNARGW